jgi:MFS family permease
MTKARAPIAIATDHQPMAVNGSPWSPLRQPLFRAFWTASLVSNLGTWMHEAGAAWLMTSLTSSPLLVALMQTATTLPVFFLGLPAGALADVVDRRRLLLFTQTWMFLVVSVLALLTFDGEVSPWALLLLTFALGAGAAMNSPAWQSTVTQLVPSADLPAAVALTGMGLNLARALGPAFGGALVAAAGAPAVFTLNAASFLFLIAVLYRWRRGAQYHVASTEPVLSAIATGIRYARQARALRVVLVRTILVVPWASALWALLPTLARHEMALDAFSYGVLFGCVGAGSVGGAIILPQLRMHYSLDALVARATGMLAVAMLGLVLVRNFGLLCLILVVAGMAWIALMASFNLATQLAVPSSLRARALALYLLVVQGGMAGGSVIWGMLAQHAGMATAFAGAAAAGLIGGLWASMRYPLRLTNQALPWSSRGGRDAIASRAAPARGDSAPPHNQRQKIFPRDQQADNFLSE